MSAVISKSLGAVLSTVGTVVGTVMQSNAESAQYQAQARQSIVQGRVSALNYELESNAIKQRVLENMATSAARAGSGNISPYESGSSGHYLDLASLSAAATDSRIALNNAEIARKMGKIEADQYFSAARTTRNFGKVAAITKGSARYVEYDKIWRGGATT